MNYREIAILESIGPTNILLPDLLEDMRIKAMGLGADAIILGDTTENKASKGIIYNPALGGYHTVSGGATKTVAGIAIKYTR